MKTLRSLFILFVCSQALATEYFSGSGTGAQKVFSYERDYTTGWINTLIAQIRGSPNLTSADRDNTLQVLDQLVQIAAQPGTSGSFTRNVGGSSGTMMITIEPDYIVDIWHVPGTQFFVSLWLQAPSAPPPNRTPTIWWTSTPGVVANGQSYTISAHAHDADGNLAQVNVYRNGAPYAFADGGNGYDGDSGNPRSDTGPQTITYTAEAIDGAGARSGTISQSVTVSAPANRAPTISWNTTPGTVGNGQSYTVSAHGHDQDGNLTQVNVYRNGSPYAFAGGGNGFDGDSGNAISDAGPQSITYTAEAVDSAGARSATISQTVTVSGPANRAPTISWNTTPGTVASGQGYTISAHGHDQDGNLTQVNVWRNGVPYAFAGGGNGFDGDSGNAISDVGPQSITYTANSVDSSGATSATISQTVTVAAAPTVSGSISASPASASAPGTTTVSWTTSNATSVSVSGNGLSSSAASGSQTIGGLGAGTYTYTLSAQGAGGPITRTAIFTVSAALTPVTASVSASPTSASAPGSTTVTWTTANATSVAVSGPGLSSSASSGSQVVSGLSAGTYDYTVTAQGFGGPVARTATFTVTAAPQNVSATIAASPSAGTAPGSTTVSWSSANATSVSVTGPGLSSAAANGSQMVTGLPAGNYTFTLTAQGSGGPITRTAAFTVSVTMFALTTTASGGGSVTPGGSYPAGTTVTIAASPNATSRFTGWTGDATGTAGSIAVLIDRAKFAQANFVGKTPQTIAFASPGDRSVNAAAFPLNATATSGLPVSFTVVSGAATLTGGNLQITGPGAVTLQASQPGDAVFLPAAPVSQTFNAIAPVVLRYRPAARTLLQSETNQAATAVVIGNP